MISAHDPLQSLTNLSPRELESLTSAGFLKVFDLLNYLPKRFEDRRRFDAFPTHAAPTPVCIRGKILDASRKHSSRGAGYFEAIVTDEKNHLFGSAKITCRWFNMPFIQKWIAAGQAIILYGKVKEINGKFIIDHPDYEIIDDEAPLDSNTPSIHLERIVPIYKNLTGIHQRKLRETLFYLCQNTDPSTISSPINSHASPSLSEAILSYHFPPTLDSTPPLRRRLALEAFFQIQLNVVWRKATYFNRQGRSLGHKLSLLTAFYRSLPFDLTHSQKSAIKEIIADMRSSHPMNRLLQGDVGSGKTFVAMAACLAAIESGCQAALMAPTQILAEQHFLTFQKWLSPLGIEVALITGNREESINPAKPPQLIIGTHALLFQDHWVSDLGLIIIDEQHKFGVAQRASLINHGTTPDVLVMTATPIPRTLTITIYGDLDVSILYDKPPGRSKIITAVRIKPKVAPITDFILEHLKAGRQAYLVYPLVEESQNLQIESATEAFPKWQKRLRGYEVEIIHGKLKPEEKESIMTRFRNGTIQVLVATSIIEVGVDVPNASIMMIHHAERFGIAQIHQLRGRIGRGSHKGFCILLTQTDSPEALEKLDVLEKSADGFEIAEADLRFRGPGDVLGTMQSGIADIKFPDLLTDFELLREARTLADLILSEDPTLSQKHKNLQEFLISDHVLAESSLHA